MVNLLVILLNMILMVHLIHPSLNLVLIILFSIDHHLLQYLIY